jgi:hypothetical protein
MAFLTRFDHIDPRIQLLVNLAAILQSLIRRLVHVVPLKHSQVSLPHPAGPR